MGTTLVILEDAIGTKKLNFRYTKGNSMKDYQEFTKLIGRILTVAFIVLKLTNTIDWSWWWILAPILLFELV